MSRKARIEDKDDWASVRMFGANLHYSTIKPNAGAFDGATVILSDGVEGDGLGGAAHALTRHAPAVRQLLFGAVAGPFLDEPVSAAPVVVLDVSPLRLECEKQGVAWATWLAGEGAARDQLDKAVGKPVARAFNKLMLESNGATLVARGGLCQLALKLLRTNDPHAVAAADKLARVVLLDPTLPTATVNALLTGGSTAASNRVSVEVAFADAAARDRRLPVLRAVLPRGCAALLPQPAATGDEAAPGVEVKCGSGGDDEGAALLGCLVAAYAPGAAAELPAGQGPYSEGEFDGLLMASTRSYRSGA